MKSIIFQPSQTQRVNAWFAFSTNCVNRKTESRANRMRIESMELFVAKSELHIC